MIRFFLFIILLFLIWQFTKKIFVLFFTPHSEVKGNSRKKNQKFDPDDIEDIDYKEVKRKRMNEKQE